jgi:hypothetical protein
MKPETATWVHPTDNSRMSILARGCDPEASLQASKAIPPMVGNPEYVPTTDDADFIDKLRSRDWSVVFFAPGACRISASNRPIPGSDNRTRDWTLDQYRELVHTYQGAHVQIVETLDERETVQLLRQALHQAHETDSTM